MFSLVLQTMLVMAGKQLSILLQLTTFRTLFIIMILHESHSDESQSCVGIRECLNFADNVRDDVRDNTVTGTPCTSGCEKEHMNTGMSFCKGQCGEVEVKGCSCGVMCMVYRNCCEDFLKECPLVAHKSREMQESMSSPGLSCEEDNILVISACPASTPSATSSGRTTSHPGVLGNGVVTTTEVMTPPQRDKTFPLEEKMDKSELLLQHSFHVPASIKGSKGRFDQQQPNDKVSVKNDLETLGDDLNSTFGLLEKRMVDFLISAYPAEDGHYPEDQSHAECWRDTISHISMIKDINHQHNKQNESLQKSTLFKVTTSKSEVDDVISLDEDTQRALMKQLGNLRVTDSNTG